MYTRLYTHVLNRHHWMYSATAFNHAYNDTGLFCISASAPPDQLAETTQVCTFHFRLKIYQLFSEKLYPQLALFRNIIVK